MLDTDKYEEHTCGHCGEGRRDDDAYKTCPHFLAWKEGWCFLCYEDLVLCECEDGDCDE